MIIFLTFHLIKHGYITKLIIKHRWVNLNQMQVWMKLYSSLTCSMGKWFKDKKILFQDEKPGGLDSLYPDRPISSQRFNLFQTLQPNRGLPWIKIYVNRSFIMESTNLRDSIVYLISRRLSGKLMYERAYMKQRIDDY